MLVQQVALFQIGEALNGHWLRGGITIGDIIHDDECVFGPALNRAYELESEVANYPRVVLDSDVAKEFGNLGDLPVHEDGVWFLEPFTLPFVQFTQSGKALATKNELMQAGLPAPPIIDIAAYEPRQLLTYIHENLKAQIRSPLADKEYNKLAWLFDRISKELGAPPARSYPRVCPT